MKKTLFLMFTLLLSVLFFSCEEGHTHQFEEKWTADDTHHWKICADKTCHDIVAKAEHRFELKEDGVTEQCAICVKERAVHVHRFAAAWTSDATHHWHVCDDSECKETDQLQEHQWDEWITLTPATCSAKGVQTRSCICGKTETRELDALAHTFGEWITVTPATCANKGVKMHVCSCGAAETGEIPATGVHAYGGWEVRQNATCVKAGIKIRLCECGDSPTEEIPATGVHSYGAWKETTAPTCARAGEKTRQCGCGAVDRQTIPATGDHQYGNWSVSKPATCGAQGEEKRSCACGDFQTKPIPATGAHVYGEWKEFTPPTCIEEGEKRQTCSCGAYLSDVIPATGICIYDTDNTCKNCEEELEYTKGLTYQYFEDEDGYYVTGTNSSPAHLVVPPYHEGKPVFGIGGFRGKDIVTVTLYENIKKIGSNAFYQCEDLQEIHLPQSLTRIGWEAFYGCVSLESIVIPAQLIEIDDSAFFGCTSLESVRFADGAKLEKIDYDAFRGCIKLSDLTLPQSITELDNTAFEGCELLIEKEGGVYYVSNWAMGAEAGVTQIVIRDGTFGMATRAFSGVEGLQTLSIPDSLQVIGYGALANPTLHTVNIGVNSQLRYIGNSAFSTSAVRSLTIPASVVHIGSFMFEGCESLSSLTFKNTKGWYWVENTDAKHSIPASKFSTSAAAIDTLKVSTYRYVVLYRE